MALKDQIGNFCWFSLMSQDTGAANSFYQSLLGWEVQKHSIEGTGETTIYSAQGQTFGNPVSLAEDSSSIPSHWIPYIAVADVDESCTQVEALGGKVCIPAFDMPSIGRTAIVNDPAGTPFHLFTPADKNEDMNMTGEEVGQVCWLELMLEDPTLVIPFYKELLGWDVSEPMPMNGGAYYSLDIGGNKIGGFMKRPDDAPEMPPMWMLYFAVPDIDKYNSEVDSLGGNLLMPKTEIPETGFFSCIADPSGAACYLFEWSGVEHD